MAAQVTLDGVEHLRLVVHGHDDGFGHASSFPVIAGGGEYRACMSLRDGSVRESTTSA